jgi:hypothetical protein
VKKAQWYWFCNFVQNGWCFKIYVKEVALKSSAWRISSFSYPRQNIDDSNHPIMGKQILIHGWQSTPNAIHRADLKKEQKEDSFF